MHTYMHTYMHIYIYAYMYVCVYKHFDIYIYIHVYIKGERQGAEQLDTLVTELKRHPGALLKMFAFDVTQVCGM